MIEEFTEVENDQIPYRLLCYISWRTNDNPTKYTEYNIR